MPRSLPRLKKPASQINRLSQISRKHQPVNPALYSNVNKQSLKGVDHLGKLRKDFKTKNTPPLNSDYSTFERIVFSHGDDPTRHHLLYGKDGGILGYYIPAAYFTARLGPDFFTILADLIKTLPSLPPSELTKNLIERCRGIPNSRTYADWRGCRSEDVVEHSARYVKDNNKDGKGQQFIDYVAPLWRIVGQIYKDIAEKSFRDIHNPNLLPAHIDPMADPFTALTINCGSRDCPVVSCPHRDVMDAFYAMACLLAFGDFQGGELILWELKRVISLKPGDVFIFPAHLITHSNTPVVGERHSLVAYTKEEMVKYFGRQGAENVRTRLPQ
jgi:hypothetical protein